MCVVRFGISLTNVIEGIDSKLNSVCLINDYSPVANLHIFVYIHAECSSISLECIKVKLLILNNFEVNHSIRLICFSSTNIYSNISCSIRGSFSYLKKRKTLLPIFFIYTVKNNNFKEGENYVKSNFEILIILYFMLILVLGYKVTQ